LFYGVYRHFTHNAIRIIQSVQNAGFIRKCVESV